MKTSGNPKILELTKSYRERSYSLSCLSAIKFEGKRLCVWCAKGELWHGSQKYCSDACSFSAMAWAYPQKEESLSILLIKQDFKCAICAFDYTVAIEEWKKIEKKPYGLVEILKGDYKIKFSFTLAKRLKQHFHRHDPKHRLEVDHIHPIYRGGSPLDRKNLQILCFSCHKAKSKTDNSGKRKKSLARKSKTKQALLEEVEILSEENDALKGVNQILAEHLEFLQGDKPWEE